MSSTATVLLPVYNAESYLEESLDSLLRQSRSDFDILAIDDASRDRSSAILADYARRDSRIRILTQPQNSGLIEVLNLGLRTITTRYVFRHDADDRAHPDRVRESLGYLERNPEVVLLGSWITRMDSHGKVIGIQKFPATDAEIRWQFLFRNPFAHSTVVFDREKAVAVGAYSPTAKHAEDYDLWLRMAAGGKLAILPRSLCDYREHDKNISNRHADEMTRQSARLGARWLESFMGTKAAERWERFRRRDALAPNEMQEVIGEILGLVKRDSNFAGYASTDANADFAWHLLSYLKRQPRLLGDARTFFPLVRTLSNLRHWPKSRWSAA